MTTIHQNKENFFIYHNYIWWSTEGSKDKDHIIPSGYDRDDIINENKYGKSIIKINRKIITLDTQIGKMSKNEKQRSYISGLTTLIVAKKIWKILKNSKSIGFMYCDGNVLKKNKTIKSITSNNCIPLTKISGPKFKKNVENTFGNKNDINMIIKNKEERGLFKKNKFIAVTYENIINNGCKSKDSPYNFLYLINKKNLRLKAQKELVYVSFICYRFGKERNPLVNKIAKIISSF